MKAEEIRIGQKVRIKDTSENGGGRTHFAKVDAFTEDIFTGETLVIVEVLGEQKVVHPKALTKLGRK